MKPRELKPTHENLLNTLANDAIGRNDDVVRFCRILNSVESNCCIAIDGAWGSGKTFFVNQVKMSMDAFNSNIQNVNENERTAIKSMWSGIVGKNEEILPQVCVYYDAWENDNDEDPMLSLVYAIIKGTDSDYVLPNDTRLLSKAAAILELFSGRNISGLVESFKNNTILDEIRSTKKVEEDIKDFLDSLLPERGNRLVVFVDELDRCKPTYAVKLLERIKHYFDNDRITFVFSINARELQHTIKRYYGEGFDAGRYLDRFFDLRVSLPPANMVKFYSYIGFHDSSYWVDTVCRAFIETYNLSLREISRYIQTVHIAAYRQTHDCYYYGTSESVKYCLYSVLPIMIGLKVLGSDKYNDFVLGRDSSALITVAKRIPSDCYSFLLTRQETFDKANTEKTVVELNEKLLQLYSALFVDDNNQRISIGKISVNSETKNTLLQTASILSGFSDINR